MAENWLPLVTTEQGLKHEIAFEGNQVLTRTSQNADQLAAILDTAKAMRTHNNGYSPDKTLKRAAVIPAFVVALWANENPPIDVYSPDPWVKAEVKRRLNSSDWAHLRTAEGRL